MRACNVVEIETPKGFRLNGLLFGPAHAHQVIIWIHGLGSSTFSRADLIDLLVDDTTAVLAFNNRGHDNVTRIVRVGARNKSKKVLAGAAHEFFTECVDDIDGAVAFAKSLGASRVYLAGHSTGCQKAVYWASKRQGGVGVSGIMLLGPLSDYVGMLKKHSAAKLAKIAAVARAMVKAGKEHELIPRKNWDEEPDDAQRFLSLYTPDSIEQSIFSYFDEDRRSKLFRAVRVPILTLLAEKDEYADRAASKIARWFEREGQASQQISIIVGAGHSFSESVSYTADVIKEWLRVR